MLKLKSSILPISERLLFRRITLDDVELWMEFFNSEEALKYMIPFGLRVGSREDCVAWIERALWRYETYGMGLWALVDKVSDQLIGQCGLLVQDIEGKQELEIGYHLLPAFWKKGYAIEAAKSCKDFAFEHQLSGTLISLIYPENLSSQAVAKRNGMLFDRNVDYRGISVCLFRVNQYHNLLNK